MTTPSNTIATNSTRLTIAASCWTPVQRQGLIQVAKVLVCRYPPTHRRLVIPRAYMHYTRIAVVAVAPVSGKGVSSQSVYATCHTDSVPLPSQLLPSQFFAAD
ncbi:MAG: hypothetical protein HPY54_08585 [Chthonomonadetes bacterium]|nr:hypothetical protein [Chthonomonadetes bacterium]